MANTPLPAGDSPQRTRQAWSVLIVSTHVLHGLLHGLDDVWRDRHPDQEDAGPQRHPVRPADVHAGAHRLPVACAAGHLDRPLRRPCRHGGGDGRHRAGDLAHELCHRVLAFPHHRPVCRPGWRLVLGGYALCGALVPQKPPGYGHGRVRCGQLGRGREQVRGPGAAGGLWLDHGAAGVRRHHAGCAGAVLDVQLQRSRPSGVQQRQVHRPAQSPQGPQGAQVLPVLQHRVRRLCGAVAVDGAVLRG